MTLREKLIAVARPYAVHAYGSATSGSDYNEVALAAARLALEDAAQACADRAGQHNAKPLVHANREDEANHCAAAIRALRDGIA